MLTALLLAAAAALVFGGGDLPARAAEAVAWIRERVTVRQAAAVVLLVAALVVHLSSRPAAPAPTPAPGVPLDLRGLFKGPTASADAATIGALCSELADEIEIDGMDTDGPFLRTGVAFDELRHRARELRCRGVSIGQRQPAARDAIRSYLDAAVGTAGGPVTPEQRSAWVAAFRDVGRAATDAAR
jgi:hypothetical protein